MILKYVVEVHVLHNFSRTNYHVSYRLIFVESFDAIYVTITVDFEVGGRI